MILLLAASGPLQSIAVKRSTGNDVSGHYFRDQEKSLSGKKLESILVSTSFDESLSSLGLNILKIFESR